MELLQRMPVRPDSRVERHFSCNVHGMQTSNKETVYELLKDFSSAMLVTHSEISDFHARPMETAFVDTDCSVWFFTDRSSPKVDEIQQDRKVLLTFQRDHRQYLALSGTAEIVTDRGLMKEHWKDSFKVWFPGGVEDPALILVRVHPVRAEYWDNSGTKGLRYLFESAKALLKGTRPEVEEGKQHGKAEFETADTV
jgi:general stress protein 26